MCTSPDHVSASLHCTIHFIETDTRTVRSDLAVRFIARLGLLKTGRTVLESFTSIFARLFTENEAIPTKGG